MQTMVEVSWTLEEFSVFVYQTSRIGAYLLTSTKGHAGGKCKKAPATMVGVSGGERSVGFPDLASGGARSLRFLKCFIPPRVMRSIKVTYNHGVT